MEAARVLSNPQHPAYYFIYNDMPRRGLRPVEPPVILKEESPARPVQHRLRPEEIAELVAAYRAGGTIDELATRFSVHRTTVMGHLTRLDVARRRRGLSAEQIGDAAKLYAQGWSLARVGERFAVSGETVRVAFQKAGVAIRPRQGWGQTSGGG